MHVSIQHDISSSQVLGLFMARIINTILLIFYFLSMSAANAGDCRLNLISVYSARSESVEAFVGQAGVVEVLFKNDSSVVSPDAFPESPLIVKNHQSKTTCAIDGGIWVRNFIFVSSDNHVLVTREYSGSSEFLNFYNTKTCKKISALSVSESNVNMDKSGVLTLISKTVDKKSNRFTKYRLGTSCLPRKLSVIK